MIQLILKKTGMVVPFEKEKIATAIYRAEKEVGINEIERAKQLADEVYTAVVEKHNHVVDSERVVKTVVSVLEKHGESKTAEAFKTFNKEHHLTHKNPLSFLFSKYAMLKLNSNLKKAE